MPWKQDQYLSFFTGPGLLSHMRNVIKEKKLRSNKWISTSVPQENWEQEYAKYASPEYFTNNLLVHLLKSRSLEYL